MGNKALYCSVENECKKFSRMNVFIKVENVIELYGDHIEADKRVEFYANMQMKQTQKLLLFVSMTRTYALVIR